MAFALFPLVLIISFGNQDIELGNAAWAFGVYFSLMWFIMLRFFMRPGRIAVSVLTKVSLFTVFIGIGLVLLLQGMPIVRGVYQNISSANLLLRWFSFTFGVGVLEEAVKALPVFLFVYKRNEDYPPITFAFAGVISGLAFGVAEAVSYSYLYAHSLVRGSFGLGSYIVIQLLRLITLPLLHACFSSIVGYFIGLASLHQTAPRALMLIGLAVAAVLHGAYNTFSNGWLGVGVAALTLLVFVAYVRTGDQISEEIAQSSASTGSDNAGNNS
jgi:RsiW-degrading membrane proteinase PrsW (M82 family)